MNDYKIEHFAWKSNFKHAPDIALSITERTYNTYILKTTQLNYISC